MQEFPPGKPVGEVALLYERETKTIWSYDPGGKQWMKLDPQGPKPPFGPKERVLAYMAPERFRRDRL